MSSDVRTLGVLFLTILMVVVAGTGVWRALYASASVAGPDGPIPLGEPARIRPATIESALDAAVSRAQTWDPGARLLSVTAQFDYPTNTSQGSAAPVGGWLVFVFVRGEGRDTEALTLLVERNRAEIMRETARTLGVSAIGLDPGLIRAAAVDSVQALIIAEAESGQAFRVGCLPTRHVARVTFRPGDENHGAAWMVSYNDSRVSNGPVLRVVVDAQTGQTTVSQLEATNPPRAGLNPCPV